MSDELKPCPFCGGPGKIEHSYHEDAHCYPRDFWHVRAVCSGCDLVMPDWAKYGNQAQVVANFHVKQGAEAKAIAAWNTRTPDPRIATLEAALMTVLNAVRAYLPPDGIDAQECLNRVIGATDNPAINPVIRSIEDEL